jgi:hypothetical protein
MLCFDSLLQVDLDYFADEADLQTLHINHRMTLCSQLNALF